jgi:hypothetical protein
VGNKKRGSRHFWAGNCRSLKLQVLANAALFIWVCGRWSLYYWMIFYIPEMMTKRRVQVKKRDWYITGDGRKEKEDLSVKAIVKTDTITVDT